MHSRNPTLIPAPVAPAVGSAAAVACILGIVIGGCSALGASSIVGWLFSGAPVTAFFPLQAYLTAVGLFHMLEFFITAHYNPSRLYDDSFLLQNGSEYLVAHAAGITEFLIELYIAPRLKNKPVLWTVGTLLIAAGQSMRTLAMVHSGSNFSHRVAVMKRDDHELVRSGVYSVMRHPSYAGFYCWAIGTQVLLGNPLVAAAFAWKLHVFFKTRIQVRFFGDAYTRYRREVASGVPLIP